MPTHNIKPNTLHTMITIGFDGIIFNFSYMYIVLLFNTAIF
jgi:hypothetical protein